MMSSDDLKDKDVALLPAGCPASDQIRTDKQLKTEIIMKSIQQYSYSLDRCLGEGSSSKVYEGVNTETGAKVAVKIIQSDKVKSQLHKSLLDNEVQALKLVYHPNIVCFYQAIFTNFNFYIISEYCPRGSLQDLLRAQGRIPEADAKVIFKQIVTGVAAVHGAGILHRDLKPANIVQGQDYLWKVTDFGFSKLDTVESKERYSVGSPLYMAPQIHNQNVYSTKSEVWALGIILYEMVFGEPPWKGNTEKSLRENLNRYQLQFIKTIEISDMAKDLIMKMLQFSKQYRIDIKEILQHPWLAAKKKVEYVQPAGLEIALRNSRQCMETIAGNDILPNQIEMLKILRQFVKLRFEEVVVRSKRQDEHMYWLKSVVAAANDQAPLTDVKVKKMFIPAVRWLMSNKKIEEASLLANTFNYFNQSQQRENKISNKKHIMAWLQRS